MTKTCKVHYGLLILGISVSLVSSATGADLDCGTAPVSENRAIDFEVAGALNSVVRWLTRGELEIKIKDARADIFSKYPNASEAYVNAKLYYTICSAIDNDGDLSPVEKRKELIELNSALNAPAEEADDGDQCDNNAQSINNGSSNTQICGARNAVNKEEK